jgi:hypothetical protein
MMKNDEKSGRWLLMVSRWWFVERVASWQLKAVDEQS